MSRKDSGTKTPTLCEKTIPITIPTIATPLRPRIQTENADFSKRVGKKYGRTMTIIIVTAIKMPSTENNRIERPYSSARKNRTNAVSVRKVPPDSVMRFFIISLCMCVSEKVNTYLRFVSELLNC